jgi:polygalacturonase
MDAIVAANYTDSSDYFYNRVVEIPSNYTFHMMGVWADGFSNIDIVIDGTIMLHKDHRKWPVDQKGNIRDFLGFENIENVTFTGNGTVDGQGYMWWVRDLLNLNPTGRPRMTHIRNAKNLEFTGIRWVNSPKQHLNVKDASDIYFHDFEIVVDLKGQLEIGRLFFGNGYTPHFL